jgi:hypothetical protein
MMILRRCFKLLPPLYSKSLVLTASALIFSGMISPAFAQRDAFDSESIPVIEVDTTSESPVLPTPAAQLEEQNYVKESQNNKSKSSVTAAKAEPVNETTSRDLYSRLYTTPQTPPTIQANDVKKEAFSDQLSSSVSSRINKYWQDYYIYESNLTELTERLDQIQADNLNLSAEYFAGVATINTRLQSGTTPSNPVLIKKLNESQISLADMGKNLSTLNSLATDTATIIEGAQSLMSSVSSAYKIPGAMEEDHAKLALLEDTINGFLVFSERILNRTQDDVGRINAYLVSEQSNIRSLSLAVSNGNIIGRSFQSFTGDLAGTQFSESNDNEYKHKKERPSEKLRLAKIKFDKPNIAYEQPVYLALSKALQQYPSSRIEVVSVLPENGNKAQRALEKAKSKRNAEKVIHSLNEMGIPQSRIDLSQSSSKNADFSEVHIFIH